MTQGLIWLQFCVAQDNLELLIHLSLVFQSWDTGSFFCSDSTPHLGCRYFSEGEIAKRLKICLNQASKGVLPPQSFLPKLVENSPGPGNLQGLGSSPTESD